MTSHYEFGQRFRQLYDKAVEQYGAGKRGASSFFSADEAAFLAANGITAQHLYDYAEDQNNYGEPGFEIALSIESVRRDYFINAQKGSPSNTTLDEASLPPKSAAVQGVEWLPRFIPKAKAKLRGELPESLMYCCGGDRRFLKAQDIYPAEFLTLVWRNFDNEAAIIDWVLARKKTAQPASA